MCVCADVCACIVVGWPRHMHMCVHTEAETYLRGNHRFSSASIKHKYIRDGGPENEEQGQSVIRMGKRET